MIHNLVLSGGSIKGFSFIGVMTYLQEHGLLSHVHHIIGTSAGSILAFMICLGMTIAECKVGLTDVMQSYAKKEVDIDNILNIYNTLGIDNGAFLWNQLSKMLYNKRKVRDITFRELAQTCGNHLVICASDILHAKTEYFSVDTTPELSVLTAIRASIAIPIIMCPVVINEKYYVDGGVFNNFPIEYFDRETKPFCDTIGIVIKNIKSKDAPFDRLNLVSYIGKLVDAMCVKLNDKIPKEKNNHIVEIAYVDEDPYDFDLANFQFNLDQKMLDRYEKHGYECAKAQLAAYTEKKAMFPTVSE